MKSFLVSIPVLALLLASCSGGLTSEEYLAKGQEYVGQKDWQSAIIEFKNAVSLSPDDAAARAALGRVYVETLDSNAAIKELTRAIELGINANEIIVPLGKAYRLGNKHQNIIDEILPSDTQSRDIKTAIYAFRAMAFLGLNNKQAALDALQQARMLDEDSTEVRLAWAWYEKSNGNLEAQLGWLNPLLERQGGIADAWSLVGEIEQNANNLEAAENAYSRSIELRPYTHYDLVRRAGVRIARADYKGAEADIALLNKTGANWPIVDHTEGLLAYQRNQLEKAQSHFLDALSRAPDYAPSQLMLSLVYYRNNNLQNALKNLDLYLAVHPDEYRPNFVYASVLLKQGKSEQAVEILNKLQKIYPGDVAVLSLLANAYLLQVNPAKATESLQQALEIQPNQAQIRLQLGSVLLANPTTIERGQRELLMAIKLNPELVQADLTLFMSYMREKRFDDARAIAKQLDEKQNQRSQGINMIALSYLGEGNKEEAIKQLQQALERFPADMHSSDLLATIYIRQNDLEKARVLYESVLQEDPKNLKSLNQLALISARQGDREKVISWLLKAQQGSPDLLSPVVLLATQYLRQKQPGKAVQLLIDTKDEHKQQPAYILLMAQAKIILKEPQHAIRALNSLVANKPEISAAHYLLAQAYGSQNQPELMRKALENTVRLSPDHLSANLALARLDLFESKFDAFKTRVGMLDQSYPGNQDVLLLKAKIDAGNKNYETAINTLSSLMEKTPRSEVVIDLSRNQWQSGDRASAISGMELWVQDNPQDSRALMTLAQFLLSDNRFEQARETYIKLDDQLPENPVVLNNLAWLIKDSNPAQGLKYAKKALSLTPDNPFIKDTLAMLYLVNGDKAEALKWSEEAVKAMPGSFDIQLNYATILAANNLKTRARNRLIDLQRAAKSSDRKQLIRNQLENLTGD